MTTAEDRQAVSQYRVRMLLTTLTAPQLRDVIAIEREHKRAFGSLAELCREELMRREVMS